MAYLTTTISAARKRYSADVLSNLRPSTQKKYTYRLDHWQAFVASETQPDVYLEDIESSLMTKYFNSLKPPAYEAGTFNYYRNIINGFWGYCLAEGWVHTNPMRNVRKLDVPEKPRLRLSASELLSILDNAEKDDPRDRAALAVGMNTGLRNQDIAILTVGSVNLTNDTLTAFIQKTQKVEEFPITAELHDEMLRWFESYARVMGLDSFRDLPNHWTLIPSIMSVVQRNYAPRVTRYKPESKYDNLQEVVQRAVLFLKMPIRDSKGKSLRIGFHTLRRSAGRIWFDTAAVENVGSAMRVTQAFLGHKSQASTEIYLGLTHDKVLRDGMMKGRSLLTNAATRDAESIEARAETTTTSYINLERRRYA